MNDRTFLRRKTTPNYGNKESEALTLVDLFCGCGGMSLGAAEAARRAGLSTKVLLAVDMDPEATAVFNATLSPAEARCGRVEQLFDGALNDDPTSTERTLQRQLSIPDLLLGGPPCQGNSNLNNHTRRIDTRNELYLRMVRATQILRPGIVIVENVPAVVHDKHSVVSLARDVLTNEGYSVWDGAIQLASLGLPQKRQRHFLIASRHRSLSAEQIVSRAPGVKTIRTLSWAIGDLLTANSQSAFDCASIPSPVNKERMDWLFAHGAHILPDALRPPCHRDKRHTYRSVYGRMRWDEPAQTITTGFGSMGQGCFVHPWLRRTLTPHEAARLQGFPDFCRFTAVKKRTVWARLIGNAVPPLTMFRLCAAVAAHRAAAVGP